MLVAEKYRLQRQVGWSDEAEVHSGPADPVHKVPLAVKIRHGMGGPPRPDGNRARFLRAVADQQAAVEAGCRQIAPIFDTGHEGDNAYYVTQHYQRSLESLIQGRVTLEASPLHRLAAGVLQALEELRDLHGRAHGNLKPTNIFLEGKSVQAGIVVLSDLALREDAVSQGADCYAFGAVIYQLVRARTIRNFDWPIENSADWERLGPQADSWREFCNVLMSPDLSARPDALVAARDAFKNMRRLVAAALKTRTAPGSRAESNLPPPRRKGLLAGIGAGVAALAGVVVLLLQPADSKLGRQFRSIPALAVIFRMLDTPRAPTPSPPPISPDVPIAAASSPTPPSTSSSDTAPAATPLVVPASAGPLPTAAPALATAATPALTPIPAVIPDATPSPPPVNPGDKWIGYTALLQQLQGTLSDPAAAEQPEILNDDLARLKDNIGYLPIKTEPTVVAFLKRLPPKLEASGDQPDLPANLWTKGAVSRDNDVQSVTYQWGKSGFQFQFNRVSLANGNGPAFYLSATAVPVQFGVVLAKMAEADGKGPLSGASSVKGPVAWEYAGGTYALRTSWMVLDNINAPFYGNAGRPSAASPMNGLSAIEAVRLARAAGCTLPTLAQWDAVLASPAGQEAQAEWQSNAKVRGPQWSAFAKGIQAQHITGAKLPNDQCFGDRADLSPVTQTADPTLFFEPVTARAVKGFASLIGNVGQYVVDDARNPTKYYFAGGSAEAAPSAFQSLTAPPVVAAPFLAAADGGLRLVASAKGNGSGKNDALDKLKKDLDAELARVLKLQ